MLEVLSVQPPPAPPPPSSPSAPRSRARTLSFNELDHEEASGILTDILREGNVFLGGCSFGVGLKKAASHYVQNILSKRSAEGQFLTGSSTLNAPHYLNLPGAQALNIECDTQPLEDSFYVVDVGVIVSQFYQWRRFFPRIEPFYAVKCNPDPIIIKTLAVLGCNFDCASRQEVQIVQELTQDLPRTPEILYANPCKARGHLIEAVCRGVRMVTFDNMAEIVKCASISKSIQLVLRIITDDRGSQCRFSSKFGAPPHQWRPLLAAAKQHGLQVVGVSFHVGSGCRDASKYELALQDVKRIFEMGKREFGFDMNLVDIGGGFPGETHSIWNPAVELDEDDNDEEEGKDISDTQSKKSSDQGTEDGENKNDNGDNEDTDRFMFFTEIAEVVAPVVDRMFPPSSGVRIIAEPGRYFVAAAATLCCSVVAVRTNPQGPGKFDPTAIDDEEAAKALDEMTREEAIDLVNNSMHFEADNEDGQDDKNENRDTLFMETLQNEMMDYSKLFATQELVQQEFDVYNDKLDVYNEGFSSAMDILGPPKDGQEEELENHTAEGITMPVIVAASSEAQDEELQQEPSGLLSLAVAGEAALSGVVMQAMADMTAMQDAYAYYINDGVYGAFNNLMFDHCRVRPRVLSFHPKASGNIVMEDGFKRLSLTDEHRTNSKENRSLYASTIFGPTCDSIDVISRSVLLPELEIGDWLYFSNMGAYTMAAASNFNGFSKSSNFYVCSIQPEYFEKLIQGPTTEETPQ